MGSSLTEPLVARSNGDVVMRMSVDDMLIDYAGEFGKWQLLHFLLTSAAWALEAFHTMVMIFTDREPERLCTSWDCAGMDPCRPGIGWDWIGGSGTSIVSEWGLICGEKYKVGIVQSVFFVGCMLGMLDFFPSFDTISLPNCSIVLIVCISFFTHFKLLTNFAYSLVVFKTLRD
jgi:MFS transporter, OCT family, solute carrier family 22 (organic cation transporter), member 4/5